MLNFTNWKHIIKGVPPLINIRIGAKGKYAIYFIRPYWLILLCGKNHNNYV